MRLTNGKKIIWLISFWAVGFWAFAHNPDGPPMARPSVAETEGAVNESVQQMMQTWPAQSTEIGTDIGGFAFPDYSFEQYAQQFRRISPDMPVSFTPEIQTYIEWFSGEKRKELEVMMGLSQYYFPIFEAELERKKMPSSLKYLPAALSALNPRSIGGDGTAGLWRLHYHTALRYGLQVNEEMDERRDLHKSTQAATAYLKDLYDQFGSWDMAIAAYACGPAGVRKAMMRSGNNRDFASLFAVLPKGQRDFIPAFGALGYLFSEGQKREWVLGKCPLPLAQEGLTVQQPVAFAALSRMSKISEVKLRDLNPLYRSVKIPAGARMAVPEGMLTMVMSLMDTIYKLSKDAPVAPKPVIAAAKPVAEKTVPTASTNATPTIPAGRNLVTYTIQPGDNLGAIAEAHHVSLTELKAWNHIRGTYIRAGDQLKIYAPDGKNIAAPKVSSTPAVAPKTTTQPTTTPKNTTTGQFVEYVVKSGDNLWTIAKKYPGVSDQDIMRWNGITEAIKPGQVLKIRKP